MRPVLSSMLPAFYIMRPVMNLQQARKNMIEQQIRTWEVLDQAVLDLLAEVHREDFMPAAWQGLAFADTRLPIGHGQTTMTPRAEARLLQSVAPRPHETVLEIGTGSAYLTALLAKSARRVTSIDLFADFIHSARAKLEQAGFENVCLEQADARDLPDRGEKYDLVIFTASLPALDERFLRLLNDGGRLFAIIGESPAMEARLITRQREGGYAMEGIFDTDLPALIGPEKETFVF